VLYWPQVSWLIAALRSINSHPYARTYAPFAVVLGLIALVLPLAWFATRRALPNVLDAVAWIAAGCVLLLCVIDLVPAGTTVKRHLAVILPVAFAPAGVVIASRLRPSIHLGLVLATLPSLAFVLFVHPKEQWREVAAYLQSNSRPDDAVAVYISYADIPFGRYFHSQRAGQVQLLSEPRQFTGVVSNSPSSTRVWLVESHAEDVEHGSASFYSPAGWGLACESRFYRVTLRMYEYASGEGVAKDRPSPPACGSLR
jgi:hypothetical protein